MKSFLKEMELDLPEDQKVVGSFWVHEKIVLYKHTENEKYIHAGYYVIVRVADNKNNIVRLKLKDGTSVNPPQVKATLTDEEIVKAKDLNIFKSIPPNITKN